MHPNDPATRPPSAAAQRLIEEATRALWQSHLARGGSLLRDSEGFQAAARETWEHELAAHHGDAEAAALAYGRRALNLATKGKN